MSALPPPPGIQNSSGQSKQCSVAQLAARLGHSFCTWIKPEAARSGDDQSAELKPGERRNGTS